MTLGISKLTHHLKHRRAEHLKRGNRSTLLTNQKPVCEQLTNQDREILRRVILYSSGLSIINPGTSRDHLLISQIVWIVLLIAAECQITQA